MKTKEQLAKEKEKALKLKDLRHELEVELEEQLSHEELEANSKVETHRVNTNQHLEHEKAKQVIEALLFASSKPLSMAEIKRVVRGFTTKQIEGMIQELQTFYVSAERGFEILQIAGGFEIATKREFAPWIAKVELQKKARQATQSALETLAIMAYKQPMTKAEVDELRGVDVSGVLSTLMEKNFIKIVGKKEVPGRPFLYGTTEKFLEHFGLNSLKDLPNIEEIKHMVQTSVKKEDLIGNAQVVPMESEGENPENDEAKGETSEQGEQAQPSEQTEQAAPQEQQEAEQPALPQAEVGVEENAAKQEEEVESESVTKKN